MQLDYSYKEIYEDWTPNKMGYPCCSLDPIYVEITLYSDHACDAVNARYNTNFIPLDTEKIETALAKKIHEFLCKKENHFAGLFGSNWHEVATKFWNNHKND